MRLKTLKNLDHRTAEGILANLTLRLLPDPGIAAPKSKPDFDEKLLDSVMNEVRNKLKLAPTDFTKESLAKVYDFISKEMSELAFAKKNTNNIKEKIGQQGDLRPDLYEIKFTDYYNKFFAWSSIRRNHVIDVLENPDKVEHLLPEKVGLTNTSPASFYFKTIHASVKNSDPFSFIVITTRKGYTQNVMLAWKIYHADVHFASNSSPIQIFEKFLDVYGLQVRCGNEVTKFIYYQKKDLTPFIGNGKTIDICDIINPEFEYMNDEQEKYVEIKPTQEEQILTNFVVRSSDEKNCVEISMAFAVNMSRYINDLKRHGDIIRESSRNLGITPD